ncbi:MAG: 3-deoxy-manno-octulosonate cytidylyltransferase [Coxiellaceae bacterium]|nr:3-deoxy-manno-octulosonate cytidylyltransferase [Coxiellaceae bacterium]
MTFSVIIPVRYESGRFPGKALEDIHGQPMIQHVYTRAIESGADTVVIATDDERIKKVAEGFNAQVCMTSVDHETGTQRLAEAVVALDWDDDDIVVHLQGDEPMICPKLIAQVAHDLEEHDNVKVTTLCRPIDNMLEIFDPNTVKVVINHRGYAQYFSRAPIPWVQGEFDYNNIEDKKVSGHHFAHIGLYAYRVGFLQKYLEMEGCPEEPLEQLEQLRVLWFGGKVHVAVTDETVSVGVDTPADLERVRQLMKKSA